MKIEKSSPSGSWPCLDNCASFSTQAATRPLNQVSLSFLSLSSKNHSFHTISCRPIVYQIVCLIWTCSTYLNFFTHICIIILDIFLFFFCLFFVVFQFSVFVLFYLLLNNCQCYSYEPGQFCDIPVMQDGYLPTYLLTSSLVCEVHVCRAVGCTGWGLLRLTVQGVCCPRGKSCFLNHFGCDSLHLSDAIHVMHSMLKTTLFTSSKNM